MTNPTVLKSVLVEGTEPNYESCVCEEAIAPFELVKRTSDHGINGVKLLAAEDPPLDITGSGGFEVGIAEIHGAISNGISPYTTTKYDQSTDYPDNGAVLVHWLNFGDKIVALATAADHGAKIVGDPMIPQTSGSLGDPDAEAAMDITAHTFVVYGREVETTDTLVQVRYVGVQGHDAA